MRELADNATFSRNRSVCFKMTTSLREYFNDRGVSGELERRGYGSSRPQLAWAVRQKPEEIAADQDESLNGRSPSDSGSNGPTPKASGFKNRPWIMLKTKTVLQETN
jgi:hypothetical protein